MSKKKKTNQGPEALNQTVFSGPAAAQQEAAVGNQHAGQTSSQTASQAVGQIPADVQELIRAVMISTIAQKRASALAITLTALVKTVEKTLKRYVKHTPALREFIRSELASMGYTIVDAAVDYGGDLYNMEVVILYKNFEIVEMIKTGRMSRLLRPLVAADEVDPRYDKMIKEKAYG
jgi:hypothetical protein